MKATVLIGATVFLVVAIMFYALITNTTKASHIHFSTRGGVLKGILYYSKKLPEPASEHRCDGKFADMADHLYPVQLERWENKYAGK